MRRREARLGKLERAVQVAVRAELEAFLHDLEAELDPPTFERILEITAASRDPGNRTRKRRVN